MSRKSQATPAPGRKSAVSSNKLSVSIQQQHSSRGTQRGSRQLNTNDVVDADMQNSNIDSPGGENKPMSMGTALNANKFLSRMQSGGRALRDKKTPADGDNSQPQHSSNAFSIARTDTQLSAQAFDGNASMGAQHVQDSTTSYITTGLANEHSLPVAVAQQGPHSSGNSPVTHHLSITGPTSPNMHPRHSRGSLFPREASQMQFLDGSVPRAIASLHSKATLQKYTDFLGEFRSRVQAKQFEEEMQVHLKGRKLAFMMYNPQQILMKFFTIWKTCGMTGGPRPHRTQLQSLYNRLTEDVHRHIHVTVNHTRREMTELMESVGVRLQHAQNVIKFCTNGKMKRRADLLVAFRSWAAIAAEKSAEENRRQKLLKVVTGSAGRSHEQRYGMWAKAAVFKVWSSQRAGYWRSARYNGGMPQSIGNILPDGYENHTYRLRSNEELVGDMKAMQRAHEEILAKTLGCYRAQMQEIREAMTNANMNSINSSTNSIYRMMLGDQQLPSTTASPNNSNLPNTSSSGNNLWKIAVKKSQQQPHNMESLDSTMVIQTRRSDETGLASPILELSPRNPNTTNANSPGSPMVPRSLQAQVRDAGRAMINPDPSVARSETMSLRLERLTGYCRQLILENESLRNKIENIESQRDRVLAIKLPTTNKETDALENGNDGEQRDTTQQSPKDGAAFSPSPRSVVGSPKMSTQVARINELNDLRDRLAIAETQRDRARMDAAEARRSALTQKDAALKKIHAAVQSVLDDRAGMQEVLGANPVYQAVDELLKGERRENEIKMLENCDPKDIGVKIFT